MYHLASCIRISLIPFLCRGQRYPDDTRRNYLLLWPRCTGTHNCFALKLHLSVAEPNNTVNAFRISWIQSWCTTQILRIESGVHTWTIMRTRSSVVSTASWQATVNVLVSAMSCGNCTASCMVPMLVCRMSVFMCFCSHAIVSLTAYCIICCQSVSHIICWYSTYIP